eukprot:scaffold232_cov203-Alexandrium_tamarense.AAC.28
MPTSRSQTIGQRLQSSCPSNFGLNNDTTERSKFLGSVCRAVMLTDEMSERGDHKLRCGRTYSGNFLGFELENLKTH